MSRIFVFEGLDLSGKSKAIEILDYKLRELNYNVGTNKGALCTNDILKGQIENSMSRFEKDLYYTYLLTQDKWLPIKKENQIILQDRYYPSVMFYGLLYSSSKSLINRLPLYTFREVENFFYFRCSFEERLRRYNKRELNGNDDSLSLQTKDEHKRRMELFDQIMQKVQLEFENVISIDTTKKKPEELASDIIPYII